MYAFLSVLLIWMYDSTCRTFALPATGKRSYVLTGLLGLLIVYTHAIGFIAVLFFGLYAASWLVTRRASRRNWLLWLAVFGGVGVLALPMLAADLVHDADMPPLQGLQDILHWLASVVVGNGSQLVGWLQPAGLLVYLAASIGGIIVPRTRRLAWCFLIAPLALCIAVGLLARPLFKTDFFSNFYSPFLALVIGGLLSEVPVRRHLRALGLTAILASLLGMGITSRLAINATERYYRAAVTEIRTHQQPGDIVWAPQGDIFWGLCWYMIGPHWGSPVSVSAPLRPGSRWYKLFDLLGPRLVAALDLLPKSQAVTAPDGTVIMTAAASRAAAEAAPRLWLVTYAGRSDLPPGLSQPTLGPLTVEQSLTFAPLQVELYQRR